jgi:hypothetical protein
MNRKPLGPFGSGAAELNAGAAKAMCRRKGLGYLGRPWDDTLARAGVRGLSAVYMLRAKAAGPVALFW